MRLGRSNGDKERYAMWAHQWGGREGTPWLGAARALLAGDALIQAQRQALHAARVRQRAAWRAWLFLRAPAQTHRPDCA
jgi:hypothetical protein